MQAAVGLLKLGDGGRICLPALRVVASLLFVVERGEQEGVRAGGGLEELEEVWVFLGDFFDEVRDELGRDLVFGFFDLVHLIVDFLLLLIGLDFFFGHLQDLIFDDLVVLEGLLLSLLLAFL